MADEVAKSETLAPNLKINQCFCRSNHQIERFRRTRVILQQQQQQQQQQQGMREIAEFWAYNCYIEALRIQPNFTIAWSNLSGLFMESVDLNRAVQYYKEAVELKPTFSGYCVLSACSSGTTRLCYGFCFKKEPYI